MPEYPAGTYPLGQLIRVSVAFTSAGVAADPTTVTFRADAPTLTRQTWVFGSTTPAGFGPIVKDSVGNYHVDLQPGATQVGNWRVRWEGSGLVTSATDSEFIVARSPLA